MKKEKGRKRGEREGRRKRGREKDRGEREREREEIQEKIKQKKVTVKDSCLASLVICWCFIVVSTVVGMIIHLPAHV